MVHQDKEMNEKNDIFKVLQQFYIPLRRINTP